MFFDGNETNSVNSTTPIPPYEINAIWGYLAVVICGCCFGSASLPIKKTEAGDGVTFSLASALALWSVGVVVHFIRNFPTFYFLPMVGGMFFAMANAKMVPILKTIGLGLGTSIRASIGIIVGWADARFGIFGSIPQHPAEPTENYVGVALSIVGALLFLFVKADVTDESTASEIEPLVSNRRQGYETIGSLANEDEDNGKNFLRNLSQLKKRILGVGLSVTAGICVGLTYAPYLYVIDRYDNASKNGLDYVFSMFTGGLISTFIYYVFYCIIEKNKPYVNPTSILPGCANGWIWGVGVSCFQFSNSVLSQAVTFPIALGLQSLMGVLYGVFLFKEIRGERNLVILILGFIATVSGTTLCGISKY